MNKIIVIIAAALTAVGVAKIKARIQHMDRILEGLATPSTRKF